MPEIPLVIDNIEAIEKTKELLSLFKNFGVDEEVERTKNSKQIRTGKGKSRNRRYVSRKGPLLVVEEENCGLMKAYRNLTGVEICTVHNLNLLKLAPGGSLGRLIIWSAGSFH